MMQNLNLNPAVRNEETNDLPIYHISNSSAPTASNHLSQSTLQPMNPQSHALADQPSFLQVAWQAIVNFFNSLLNCFWALWQPDVSPNDGGTQAPTISSNEGGMQPSIDSPNIESPRLSISLEELENQLNCTEAEIHQRLDRQMQRSQKQMEKEPVKGFAYFDAPEGWDMHEEMVGNLHIGFSHVQGRRDEMEDEHLAVHFNLNLAGRNYPIQLFGIFDGHGGTLAACFVRDNLQKKLEETLIEYNQDGLSEAGIWKALKMACVRLNRDLKEAYWPKTQDATYRPKPQGTTAAIMMVLNGVVYSANVGDSRIVLDNDGTTFQLTEDAKPNDERYQKGIEKRGGIVEFYRRAYRVNFSVATARAFGDFHADGAVSARPKITAKPLSEIQPGSHLILCCDGIYDVSRTIEIVNAAHKNRNLSPGTLARNITYSALMAGSEDNLSAMVVKI